jgi:CheY-like chemotaxis protein
MVEEVSDGDELLEYLATLMVEGREDEVDLIISEQELPGIPGLSVLAGLRARRQEIPFVLMTGDGLVQARAVELGGVILDRPFNLGAIRGCIHRAVAEVGAHDREIWAPANDVRLREGHS